MFNVIYKSNGLVVGRELPIDAARDLVDCIENGREVMGIYDAETGKEIEAGDEAIPD